jgi:hypothetical protein
MSSLSISNVVRYLGANFKLSYSENKILIIETDCKMYKRKSLSFDFNSLLFLHKVEFNLRIQSNLPVIFEDFMLFFRNLNALRSVAIGSPRKSITDDSSATIVEGSLLFVLRFFLNCILGLRKKLLFNAVFAVSKAKNYRTERRSLCNQFD